MVVVWTAEVTRGKIILLNGTSSAELIKTAVAAVQPTAFKRLWQQMN